MNDRHCVIADDLRAYQTLLRNWIEPCGYICETTANGEQAWNAIVKSNPSLVVTDIEMPGASGLDLLCSLRSHSSREIRSIPVIVISSLIDRDIQQFVREVGATYYLPKPLDKQVTQSVVRNLCKHVNSAIQMDPSEYQVRYHSAFTISPTLRRLYRDARSRGPRFR